MIVIPCVNIEVNIHAFKFTHSILEVHITHAGRSRLHVHICTWDICCGSIHVKGTEYIYAIYMGAQDICYNALRYMRRVCICI